MVDAKQRQIAAKSEKSGDRLQGRAKYAITSFVGACVGCRLSFEQGFEGTSWRLVQDCVGRR
jgi:hypothetical protein